MKGVSQWEILYMRELKILKMIYILKNIYSIKTTWKTGRSIENDSIDHKNYKEILPYRRFWSSPGSPIWKSLINDFENYFKSQNNKNKITILAKEESIKAIKNIINDPENSTKSSHIISKDPIIYNHILLDPNEDHEIYLNHCRIDLLKLVINNWVIKLYKRKQPNLNRKYYHDIAIISILFGTKFTPKFLMLSINLKLIESIVKDYIKRSSESLLNNDHSLNINEVYILFNCLAKKKTNLLKKNYCIIVPQF